MQMIRPLQNRVLILPSESEGSTAGGILLPDSAKERPTRGVVVAIGEGLLSGGVFHPVLVQVGDTVIYDRYEGKEIKDDDGTIYKIMPDTSVLAVIGEIQSSEE